MFSNIVVGTDGSETAGLAVALAADLAKLHGATLHLVNAYKAPSASVGAVHAGPSAVADEAVSAELSKDASTKTLEEAAAAAGPLKVELHSEAGSPADAIIGVAEAVHAELIVVGSKGMQGARRMLGSVPNTVAHHATCHVLVAKTA